MPSDLTSTDAPTSPDAPTTDATASHGAGRPYYLTTAIAYPNGAPHIGHAYEYISADALARFKRLDGFDVRFLTGTDVHGQKMQQTAEKEGIPTAELANRNSDRFQELQDRLGSSYHRFIRTSDEDHKRASAAIWQRMAVDGDSASPSSPSTSAITASGIPAVWEALMKATRRSIAR